VVTGCYAQRAPEEIAALPGVSQVIGNSHKYRLAEIAGGWGRTSDRGLQQDFVPLAQLTSDVPGQGSGVRRPHTGVRSPIFVSDIFAHTELQAAPVFDAADGDAGNGRTRPNLKVQDGCDNRCSFCVIPYVRGHSRSLPLGEVIREVGELVTAGYREVVISGINLGRWGRDVAQTMWGGRPRPPAFEDLVRAILSETALEKLRISSVEPMDWSDQLIGMMAQSPRIAKHAHVPLQSGSDAVLRRMHRKYRPWHYREKIEKIRAAMPTAAIGADVMVGFPGETDAEFDDTCRLVKDLPFTYLHVFTYSARPGTPAAALGKQVPVHAARERHRVLSEIVARKKLAFMSSFVGQAIETITLNTAGRDRDLEDEYTEALTDNFLPVRVRGNHPPNRWIPARIERVSGEALIGIAA